MASLARNDNNLPAAPNKAFTETAINVHRNNPHTNFLAKPCLNTLYFARPRELSPYRKTPFESGLSVMKKQLILGLLAAAASSQAATFTTFSYNQSDATTGAGTISAFSYAGHDFPAMNMPAATVLSPGTI